MSQFITKSPAKSPAKTLVAWALLAMTLFMGQAWAAVGYVHEVIGSAFMRQGSAPERAVAVGQSFDPGATFRTGANSTLVLKFEDGQLSTLRADSSFRVDQFSFNPRNPSAGNSAIALLTGTMRFVTGLIGSTNRGNVRIAAGTATIGIRGTDIVFDAQGNAFVMVGGISLTPGGSTQPILISLGQFASVTNPTAGPVTGAPGLFQASANQLSSLILPENAPATLTTAIAAVVAKADAAKARADAAAAAKDAVTAANNPNATSIQRALAAEASAKAAAAAAQLAATAAGAEAAAARAALNILNVAVGAGATPAPAVARRAPSVGDAILLAQQGAATPDAVRAALEASTLAAEAAAKEAVAAAGRAADQAGAASKAAEQAKSTNPETAALGAAKALAAAGAATAQMAAAGAQQTLSTAVTSNLSAANQQTISTIATNVTNTALASTTASNTAQQSTTSANALALAKEAGGLSFVANIAATVNAIVESLLQTDAAKATDTIVTIPDPVTCLPSPC